MEMKGSTVGISDEIIATFLKGEGKYALGSEICLGTALSSHPSSIQILSFLVYLKIPSSSAFQLFFLVIALRMTDQDKLHMIQDRHVTY